MIKPRVWLDVGVVGFQWTVLEPMNALGQQAASELPTGSRRGKIRNGEGDQFVGARSYIENLETMSEQLLFFTSKLPAACA
ncbi:hypothetical protein [Pseudomonas viridiflava]|uniref:hypothetical protein n=1 Tax=Pseudomonas viridiflava TaxID=33069 RepID=UPI000F036EFA|nr:hypothetical protein [Pseudomonas viridiflava]